MATVLAMLVVGGGRSGRRKGRRRCLFQRRSSRSEFRHTKAGSAAQPWRLPTQQRPASMWGVTRLASAFCSDAPPAFTFAATYSDPVILHDSAGHSAYHQQRTQGAANCDATVGSGSHPLAIGRHCAVADTFHPHPKPSRDPVEKENGRHSTSTTAWMATSSAPRCSAGSLHRNASTASARLPPPAGPSDRKAPGEEAEMAAPATAALLREATRRLCGDAEGGHAP